MTDNVLSVRDLKVWFGGVRAVDGVDIDLAPGKIHGVVGPNGSGKTTLINAVSRLTHTTSGSIRLTGQDITKLSAHRLRAMGLARTFQHIRLVPTLSVRQNVLSGLDRSAARTPFWHFRGRAASRVASRHAVDSILERLELTDVSSEFPNRLSYGTQRRVEIGRAIASNPTLMLLDEPLAGMTRGERTEIASLLGSLRADGITQLVVEHDLRTLINLCDRMIVMNFGKVIADGDPLKITALPHVREAYLGSTDDPA